MRWPSLSLPAVAWLGIIAISGSGCAAHRTVDFDEHCCIAADRLEIHYELDGFRGGYWSRALTIGQTGDPADDGGKPRETELPHETKTVTCQRAELHVVWPHSECRPDKARAIIRLWHRSRGVPARHTGFHFGRQYGKALSVFDRRLKLPEEMEECNEQKRDASAPEIYTLDFQRSELDLILPELVCAGFFKDQYRPNGGARLIVQVDDKRVQKSWTPEPRLDDLLTRVSIDGRRFEDTLPGRGGTGADHADPPHAGAGRADDSESTGRSKVDAAPGDLPLPPPPNLSGPNDESRRAPNPGAKSDGAVRDDARTPGPKPDRATPDTKSDGRSTRRSKRAPKAVQSDDAARPIPLPPPPSSSPDFESSPPPFEEPARDDALPPSLPVGEGEPPG